MGIHQTMRLLTGLDHLPETDDEAKQAIEAIFKSRNTQLAAFGLYNVYRKCGHSVLESYTNVLHHAVGEHDKAVALNAPKAAG